MHNAEHTYNAGNAFGLCDNGNQIYYDSTTLCFLKVFDMIRQIDNEGTMTCREAKEKYEQYYIGFVTTEQNMSNPDCEVGYVICIMDTYEEGFSIPRRTEDNSFVTVMPGYAVGGKEIGGVYFNE